MANSYYNATGVIILKKVTPIIKVFFDPFDLDPEYPGDGEAYVACTDEHTDQSWDSIERNLWRYIQNNKLDAGKNNSGVKNALQILVEHFKLGNNKEVSDLINESDFLNRVEFDVAFMLAKCFDDGHGLTSYQLEGSWYCYKPRLFAYGGQADYRSEHLVQSFGDVRIRC